ncbi:MAG TPA: hypothetical protein VKP66_00600 [Steroidobacteraceae bacterium]|nr:hypothetical protein [Steroidobacteraceae bacterium]
MNALQTIPPKPAMKLRRSALLFRVAATILLLVVGRISMSRGEDGIVAAPDALAETKDSGDNVSGNDKSLPVTPPAEASAAATTKASRSGGSEEKGSVPARPIVQSAKSATEPPPTPAASVAPKSGLAPKSEDTKVRKTASDATPAPSAEPARRIHRSNHQPKGQVDYRRSKLADGVPVWVGPPPIIYGPGPDARAPYAAGSVDGTKTPDRMSIASVRGAWERVVEAPGAVLNGGKRALYGVLDSIW